jgi:hypothetical protein
MEDAAALATVIHEKGLLLQTFAISNDAAQSEGEQWPAQRPGSNVPSTMPA